MIDQPEASYRLDKPTHAQPEARTQAAGPEAESAPPPGWISLPECTLSGGPGPEVAIPLVLLHPEVGVALLGVPPAAAPVAEAALRERLESARFSSIFSGHLPVVSLAMLPGEPLNLRRRLAAAFATVPPLELGGGDGWVNVVRRALLVRPPIRLVSPVVLPPEDEEAAAPARSMRPSPRHGRQRNWILPLAGLTGAGVLVGLMLGLHGTPPDLGTGAEMVQPPTTSAAPAQPAAPPPPSQAPTQAPAQAEMVPRTRPEAAPPPVVRQQALPPAMAAAPPAIPPAAPTQPAPTQAAPTPATPTPAAPAEAAPALPRVLVRSAANLRAGPDNHAAVLRTAPRGEAFRVHGEARGGWVQVGDARPEGWIHSSLLSDLH